MSVSALVSMSAGTATAFRVAADKVFNITVLNTLSDSMQRKIVRVLELSLIVLLIAGTIRLVNRVGSDQIRNKVAQYDIWAPLIILLLRLTSIIVPVLPGTAYAVLAGALFGFGQGLNTGQKTKPHLNL